MTARKFAEATGMEAIFVTTRFLLEPGTDENGRQGLSDKTMNALCKLVWDAAQPAIQKAIDDGMLPILMAEGGFIDASYPSEKAVARRAKRRAEREKAKAEAKAVTPCQ